MKVCLAGTYAITNKNKNIIKDSKYVLESFYYIQDWQLPYIKEFDLFLLDSGAFTFMNNIKDKTKIDFDDYLTRYINFINKNDIKYFFELDIDVVVGYEKVKELRRRLERETGKKCIPVWHRERGKEDFIKMCQEYDYVAIGGLVGQGYSQKHWKYFPWFIDTAHKYGAKIHALGFTSIKGLKKYKFDSVDSTSWKSGNRFGTLHVFKNDTLVQVKKRDGYRLKSGDYYSKIEKFNFDEWVKYQKYMSTK